MGDDCLNQSSVQGGLLNAKTGILEVHVRARILSQGAREVRGGPPGVRVMFFEALVGDRWRTFSVPKAMGRDGYRMHELDVIEQTLQRFEIELYPIDAHLN